MLLFFVGLFIGSTFGYFIACLVSANHTRSDKKDKIPI